MPYQTSAALVKEFPLTKTDEIHKNEGDPTVVKIRQVKMGDKKLRDDLYAKFERRFDGNTVTVSQVVSLDDVQRKEVYLTLAGCNICASDGKTPLFQFEGDRLKNEHDFNTAWATLDDDVAAEIHDKVMEMNLMWNPNLGETISQID